MRCRLVSSIVTEYPAGVFWTPGEAREIECDPEALPGGIVLAPSPVPPPVVLEVDEDDGEPS